MESLAARASTPAPTGPQDLSRGELERFGLGVVVRHLRVQDAPLMPQLSRVYCLFCGIAIDHEQRAHGWWFCRNECNVRSSH